MNFLEKIDYLMKRMDINKRELSQISGVPYTTIDGFYKKGYENIKLSTLRKIATALGVTIDYLTYDEKELEAFRHGLSKDELRVADGYSKLDPHGKAAVDSILQCELDRMASEPPEAQPATYYVIPFFPHPSSAGTGTEAFGEKPENLRLVKEPPKGASYVVPVSGDSMEPTYQDGDMVFVAVRNEIDKGQVGIFYMDGQQWIKEKGDGVLISHNSDYPPRPIVDGAQCQGLVLGLCDSSYFEN